MAEPTQDRTRLENLQVELRRMALEQSAAADRRVLGLLIGQAVLFATFSLTWLAAVLPALVIAAVGLVSTISVGHALRANLNSLKHFKQLWEVLLQREGLGPRDFLPLDGGHPEDGSRRWLLPALVLPPLLLAAWVTLVIWLLASI